MRWRLVGRARREEDMVVTEMKHRLLYDPLLNIKSHQDPGRKLPGNPIDPRLLQTNLTLQHLPRPIWQQVESGCSDHWFAR